MTPNNFNIKSDTLDRMEDTTPQNAPYVKRPKKVSSRGFVIEITGSGNLH